MARRVYEGTVNVYFATTVADISAPKISEITGATDITCFLTKDGLAPNITTNNVDSGALCDVFDGQIPGSFGADFTLTMFRDDYDDAAWELVEYGETGFIIVEPFGAAGELPVAGDPVEVYEGAWHQKSPANSAANTQQTFTAPFPCVRVDLDAVVATG